MIKKYITYLLVFCIMISSLSGFSVNAEENSGYNEIKFENSLALLRSIDAIDKSDEFEYDSTVTRGKFASIIAKALAFSYSGTKDFFSDVTSSHKFYKDIQALSERGIVVGNNGEFYPDNNISYYEALHMLLVAMGYKTYLLSTGDYPYSDIRVANRLSFERLSDDDTCEDLFYLLYQALNTDILEISSMPSADLEEYETTDGETLLSKYRNLYSVKGILQSNGIVSINPSYTATRSQIVVDNTVYVINEVCDVLAGCEVDVFYNKDTYEASCILATPDNSITEIKSQDIEGYDNMQYTYKKGNRTAKKSISNKSSIVYNYKYMTKYDESLMVPDTGEIIIIDNKQDSEIIYINSYVSFLLNTVVDDNKYLILSPRPSVNTKPVRIYMDDDEKPLIYDKNGNFVDVSKIKAGMVVSVLANEENGIMNVKRAVLSSDTVMGDLTEMSKNDGVKLTVDGKIYNVAKCADSIVNYLSFQPDMKFYIDFMGNIVDVDTSATGLMAYGYLIDADRNDDSGKKTINLKIFSEIGSVVTYRLAEKVNIDDEKITVKNDNISSILDRLKSGSEVKEQVIRYGLNNDKEINCIDLPQRLDSMISSTMNNRLYKSYSMESLYYRKDTRKFSGRISVTDKTIIFAIPDNAKEAENYEFQILGVSDIPSEGRYYVESYVLGENNICSDVLVMKYNYNQYPVVFDDAMIVKKKRTTLNSIGDETYVLLLDSYDGEKEFIVKDKLTADKASAASASNTNKYPVENGDLIKFITNRNGEIEDIKIIYKFSSGQMLDTIATTTATFLNNIRCTMGRVYSKNNQYIQVTYEDLSSIPVDSFLQHEKCEIYDLSKFKIITVEKSGSKVYIEDGKANDIITFKDGGIQCSKVVICTSSGKEKLLLIIKDA